MIVIKLQIIIRLSATRMQWQLQEEEFAIGSKNI
jgi:hypothetical protein